MDGVPGVTFKGIDPGETFVYRFPLKQYGTYWYRSHSGMQEQLGLYGPLVIDPAAPEPFRYDRDHIVVLSDWTFADPMRLLAKLKKQSNFSNQQRLTVGDFIDGVVRLESAECMIVNSPIWRSSRCSRAAPAKRGSSFWREGWHR
jgi:FtsP/CotA-like multicopper oxidase with cupredoxin domain